MIDFSHVYITQSEDLRFAASFSSHSGRRMNKQFVAGE